MFTTILRLLENFEVDLTHSHWVAVLICIKVYAGLCIPGKGIQLKHGWILQVPLFKIHALCWFSTTTYSLHQVSLKLWE